MTLTSSTSNELTIERQLREQILANVDKILLKDRPSRTSLCALLKLCSPNLDPSTLDNAVAREKAFRMVKARLHPDKFDATRRVQMTQVFQNVQTYYVQCCHALADEVVGRYGKRHSGGRSTATATTTHPEFPKPSFERTDSPKSVVDPPPPAFDAFGRFPHLRQIPRPCPPPGISTGELQYHLAYACLNLRGAVLHGQAIDCTYQVPLVMKASNDDDAPTGIEAVWEEAGFPADQCKRLVTVEDIKQEILRHGPVVSTSFVLDPFYYNSNQRYAGNFSERHVAKPHPLLITGWTMSAQGEVWCVQALRGPPFTIGVGQFEIDKHCLVPPTGLLLSKSWQSPGPYWDVSGLAGKCPAWRDHFDTKAGNPPLTLLDVLPVSSAEIELLGDLWNVGLNSVIMERRTFVVRDLLQQAHSRRVLLREIARVEHQGKKTWKVTLSVIRN